MKEEKDRNAFNTALSGMVRETAYRRAIRHLYDSGLDAGEIAKQLSFPVSMKVIEAEIEAYRAELEKKAAGEDRYEYRMETDSYGRPTYTRIKIPR